MPAGPLRVCYLPWAELEEEARVGPVRFVPFAIWLESFVPDVVTRRFWERYARCHIGMDGGSVGSLTMAVVDGAVFGVLTAKQEDCIHRAADALAFAHLTSGYGSRALPENRGAGGVPIAHVDRFMLYSKSFMPTDRSATITTYGGMANWSLAQLKWQRPPHVWGGLCVSPDKQLLAGLGRIVAVGPRHPFANQVWAALHWTRVAFSGGDGVEDAMRFVIMMTAYEALLAKESIAIVKAQGAKARRGGGDVKRAFKSFVNAHLNHQWLAIVKRDFKSGGIHQIPIPADWFYEGFDLRGGIVHGESLRATRGVYRGHPHLLLAVLFMWVSVKARLVEGGLIPTHMSRKGRATMAKLSGSAWTKRDEMKMEFNSDDLRRLYSALNWYSAKWKKILRKRG